MSQASPSIEIVMIPRSDSRFADAAAVRKLVFMDEQHATAEEEWDDKDELCTHGLAYYDGEAIGTIRFWNDDGWFHVGRLAVVRKHRGKGIAKKLMRACLEMGVSSGLSRSFLNAQVDKQDFYRAFGYESVGGEFMDGPVLHRRMEMNF